MGETTNSVTKKVKNQKGSGKERTNQNFAVGQKNHFKCIRPAKKTTKKQQQKQLSDKFTKAIKKLCSFYKKINGVFIAISKFFH